MAVIGMLIGVVLLVVLPREEAAPAELAVVDGAPLVTATGSQPALATGQVASGAVAEAPLEAPPVDPANPPTPNRAVGTAEPNPDVLPGYFVTVESGDTLWMLAIEANIALDDVIAANPDLDPNVLQPGDRVLIPDPASPTNQVVPGTGPTPAITAYVSTDGDKLNLRSSPDETLNVITTLPPGTALNVVGRSADNVWLQVVTASGQRGWVMVQFVTLQKALADIPVSAAGDPVLVETLVAEAPPTATLSPTLAPTVAQALTPIPTPLSLYPEDGPQQQLGGPLSYPYISNVTESSRRIYQLGQSLGNRPDVFSKVGDSITVASAFMTPVGTGEYDLREYAYLGSVVEYYSGTIARNDNSFANTSLTAKGGWSAWTVLNPGAANREHCLEDEVPLVCEYRLVRPSVALIMLGTNDVANTGMGNYEEWMRETVEISISMGVIPVLSTIPEYHRPDVEGRVQTINGIIRNLSYEFDVPLWDYHAALEGLPNDGLSSDGIHPSWSPTPGPADFSPESLQNGMTVRNLTALQALDAIWREVVR
jgi:LysM repeat protein